MTKIMEHLELPVEKTYEKLRLLGFRPAIHKQNFKRIFRNFGEFWIFQIPMIIFH
jgi:hypothetical protein